VPGEKLVDLMDGMVSDACEDVGEVGVGIDAVHPAGFDDGVHAGGALSAGIGATEEVVFAPENRRAHGPLGGIVRHLKPTVEDVEGQRLPACEGVADRLRECALAAHLAERGFEERLQLLQQRLGVFLAHGGPLLGRAPTDAALDDEQGSDPFQRLQGDRRGRGLVHVIDFAAHMAPAGNFDQWRVAAWLGRSVEALEATDMLCITYRWICCPGIYVVPAPACRAE
jgi:hypothetical protein